jgi:hypothetical protein
MNMIKATTASIEAKIAKGWKPNMYLTNMSVAYFQPDDWYVSPFIFPILPVSTSVGRYKIFDKGDLARDNVQRKPEFGKVTPMLFGSKEDTYSCVVDQVIVGIDQISTLDYQRGGIPGMSDPRRAKVRVATEQLKLHADINFAKGYFQPGIWTQEYSGVTSTPGTSNFYKFNDSNFDAISFFGKLRREMMREGRRKPNVLALGVDAYEGLKTNPDLLDRVKYGGSTPNPATVNTNVLAQLLEIDKIVVLNSVYNAAGYGQTDMQFVCDSKSALLAYAAPNPAIDEASAGYTLAWDMLGNGQYTAFDQWPGENGTHSDFIEGLMSSTPKKVCDELGVFLKETV